MVEQEQDLLIIDEKEKHFTKNSENASDMDTRLKIFRWCIWQLTAA